MQRNNYIDLMKAVSIFGVVWIHGASILGGSDFTSFVSDAFRFAVPAFIIFWAYFFEKSFSRASGSRLTFLANRFSDLFVVFLIWSVLYFLVLADFDNLSFSSTITRHFSGYGWSGQYFFIILFQLILFYSIIRWAYSVAYIRFLCITVCVVLYFWLGYFGSSVPDLVWKLGDRLFVYWIPYVFVGIYFARREVGKEFSFLWCILPLLIPLEFNLLSDLGRDHGPYVTPMVLLCSILVTIPFLSVNYHVKRLRLYPIVEFLGTNTMIVFVMNAIVVIILRDLFSPFVFYSDGFWVVFSSILSTVSCIVPCLLFGYFINKSRLKGILN